MKSSEEMVPLALQEHSQLTSDVRRSLWIKS